MVDVKAAVGGLTGEYAMALGEHLEDGGEEGLHCAYELGRAAVRDGIGVLELAFLHQEALVAWLLRMLAAPDGAVAARRASEFLAESLAPFEMTRRGVQEANDSLKGINKELERRMEAVLHDYQDVRDQLHEQRRLERLKNEFISVVSHELRTPLTSIHGALGLISTGMGGDLSPRGKQLLEVACRNSERLVRLVGDILDLQKIESGAMQFHLRPIELRSLLEHSIEANQAYAAGLGVALALLARPAEARVYADPDRLVQVMTNLLSNAAKFSPSGDTVVVSAERHGDSIRVSVTDRGPGIPEDFRHRVFQKFAQADSSTTREKGGTGLGLSISKAIIERLGGRMGFTTGPGAGTTFHFELPEWRPDAGQRGGTD
jgi:signal transduction histidine kinase